MITTASNSEHTYHVAPNGNDSNSGLSGKPWATIQHAADVVNPGDTVIVADGTYAETVAITRGGTSSSPISFRAENKWKATIAPQSTAGNSNYTLYFSRASYVTVRDFEITGTPDTAAAVKFDSGTNNVVIGNNIHSVGVSTSKCLSGAGILIADNNETVDGNLIWNVGPPRSAKFRCNQQHGIYIAAGTGGKVQNNIVSGIWQGYGIHLDGVGLSAWIVANNTVINSGDNAHNTGGPFIFSCGGGTCDNNVFVNNLFSQTQGGRCFWEFPGKGKLGNHNSYTNNLTHNCGTQDWITGYGKEQKSSDPQFRNYTGGPDGDYHLKSGSPAIDAGTPVNAPATDFDGTQRPQLAGFDIGAYEATAP